MMRSDYQTNKANAINISDDVELNNTKILAYLCDSQLDLASQFARMCPDITIAEHRHQLKISLTNHPDYYKSVIVYFKPGMDYQSLIQSIREYQKNAQIIFLSNRTIQNYEIALLYAGADNFLCGPLTVEKILAHVYAMQKRWQKNSPDKIYYNDICVNKSARSVSFKSQYVDLSRREYDLLIALLQAPGKIRTRDYLIRCIYGLDDNIDSNTLEVHVHQLRKKINHDMIKTIRGIGYQLI